LLRLRGLLRLPFRGIALDVASHVSTARPPHVTDVTLPSIAITDKPQPPLQNADMQTEVLSVLRLDYLSCVLTILSTILIGRRCWEGWVVAAVNSLIICMIGIRTAQLGFVPANLFCIALYALNLRTWRKAGIS